MPDGTGTDSTPVRLVPATTPGPIAVPLGDWHGHGLCAGENPDIFFPSNGDSGTKAREICAGCAVRSQCLDYAVEADEFGIWGGMDQEQRRRLRRRWRRTTPTRLAVGDAG